MSSEVVIEDIPEPAQLYQLVLVNASGRSGIAAELKSELEREGYRVDELRSDLTGAKERTVIVFDPTYEEAALALSARLGNALLSASTEAADKAVLTVFIGAQYVTE